MIRPFTCLCVLLAAGSGLYLYQEKHRAEMLDRQIGQVVKATDAARERTGMLRAEWTLLNEPERLQDLAGRYLQLQPMAPAQFVQMSALDSRLPAVPPPPEAVAPAPAGPMAQAAPEGPAPAGTAVAVATAAPIRPAGPPATADLGPFTAPTAPVRMASADIAQPAPAAQPQTIAATGPHDASARAAPRQPLRRKAPSPTAQQGLAGGFVGGPSAEPRPLGSRQVMAPIVDAFATPHPAQINRPATVQRTEAYAPVFSSGMSTGGSALGGSALGGGRPSLAPPVPIAGQQ